MMKFFALNLNLKWGIGVLALIGSILFVFTGPRASNPNLRQPHNVSAGQNLSSSFQLKKNSLAAKKSAERLDDQASVLREAQFMSVWSRWQNDINVDDLREQYSRDLIAHLNSMTLLLKYRREGGGDLKKLNEFEFQNLVRRSDCLLALPITKMSFEYLGRKGNWHQAVQNYNSERLLFDSKKIVVAEHR